MAQENPERAPCLDPCIRIPKDNGPGASAPDAVTTTTVATKSNKFILDRSLESVRALSRGLFEVILIVPYLIVDLLESGNVTSPSLSSTLRLRLNVSLLENPLPAHLVHPRTFDLKSKRERIWK